MKSSSKPLRFVTTSANSPGTVLENNPATQTIFGSTFEPGQYRQWKIARKADSDKVAYELVELRMWECVKCKSWMVGDILVGNLHVGRTFHAKNSLVALRPAQGDSSMLFQHRIVNPFYSFTDPQEPTKVFVSGLNFLVLFKDSFHYFPNFRGSTASSWGDIASKSRTAFIPSQVSLSQLHSDTLLLTNEDKYFIYQLDDPLHPVVFAAAPNNEEITYVAMNDDYIFLSTTSNCITLHRQKKSAGEDLSHVFLSGFDESKLAPFVKLPPLMEFSDSVVGGEILASLAARFSSEGDLALILALSILDRDSILTVLETHSKFAFAHDVKDAIRELASAKVLPENDLNEFFQTLKNRFEEKFYTAKNLLSHPLFQAYYAKANGMTLNDLAFEKGILAPDLLHSAIISMDEIHKPIVRCLFYGKLRIVVDSSFAFRASHIGEPMKQYEFDYDRKGEDGASVISLLEIWASYLVAIVDDTLFAWNIDSLQATVPAAFARKVPFKSISRAFIHDGTIFVIPSDEVQFAYWRIETQFAENGLSKTRSATATHEPKAGAVMSLRNSITSINMTRERSGSLGSLARMSSKKAKAPTGKNSEKSEQSTSEKSVTGPAIEKGKAEVKGDKIDTAIQLTAAGERIISVSLHHTHSYEELPIEIRQILENSCKVTRKQIDKFMFEIWSVCRYYYRKEMLAHFKDDPSYARAIQRVERFYLPDDMDPSAITSIEQTATLKKYEGVLSGTVRPEDLEQTEKQISLPSGKITCSVSIGKGAFGKIYRGKYNKREVAIKTLQIDADTTKDKLSELFFLMNAKHPNVSFAEGAFRVSPGDKNHKVSTNQLWIVMEFCKGGNLEVIAQQGELTVKHFVFAAREILKGLAYIHSRRWVHRDLKSANIMMNLKGEVKIIDFGFSIDLAHDPSPVAMIGSPFWISPEMIRYQPHGCPTDIWSFGVTMIEFLSKGHCPYHEFGKFAPVICMIRASTIGLAHKIPSHFIFQNNEPQLLDFLTRCLEVNPDKRGTAAELLEHPLFKQDNLNAGLEAAMEKFYQKMAAKEKEKEKQASNKAGAINLLM